MLKDLQEWLVSYTKSKVFVALYEVVILDINEKVLSHE